MDKTGGSRLLQMQARFQQKQLQEREHKIASLYEAQQARALDRVRQSPGNGVSASPPAPAPAPAPRATPPVPHQPGKVRQMFEERRTKAGIDKSYPLQPIQNTERTQQRKTLPNGYKKVTDTVKTVEKKISKTHTSISSNIINKKSVTKVGKVDNLINGSVDVNHNHEIDINTIEVTPQSNGDISNHYIQSKLPVDETDNAENNYLIENETFPEALAPTPTPRSSDPVEKKQPEKKQQKKTPPPRQSKSPLKVKPQSTAPSPRSSATEKKTVNSKPRTGMRRASNPVSKKPPIVSGPTNSLKRTGSTVGEGCAVCGRRFAPDRLAKHQDICKKASTKKRKPFDVLKHRLAGTEAEPFINKLRKSTAPTANKSQTQNSTWRQKHEDFIQAIRAAKQVQAHLNAGGKLSDLPPPPPSQNPDYVQCPHCSRRFNQGAAERHIPKCANFQFNKPKKPSPKRR